MPNLEKEETIDLGRLAAVMAAHKKTCGAIIGTCTAVALVTSLLLPKTYESSALVQTRSAGSEIGSMAAMAAAMGVSIGGGGSAGSPTNYIELMKSRTVLEPIIAEVYTPDVESGDMKKLPTAETFAKKNLDIKNTKQTNLITVTAKGRTPEEAQLITQSVVDNFLAMQTNMNYQTQSILVKFLESRIADTRKESDEAEAKLAAFSREHKVYAPDEQVKALLTTINAYDKSITEQEVAAQSAAATYAAASEKLGEQRSGARAYDISDNATVQSIRAQIVAKNVEIVGLQQKYTEQHPSIINARDQLAELNSSLEREVNAAVSSGAATLNSAYTSLLQTQALAQAQQAAAEASAAVIRDKRDEKEKEIGDLPEDAMTYYQLTRDAGIKKAVYTQLVTQSENTKIKEAMESMDIQVVDSASLPDEDEPAGPKKKLITAIGLFVGCLISLGYGLVRYRKES